MTELNEAYAILSDPTKRARYDEQIGLATPPSPDVVPGDSRPTRRGATNAAAPATDQPLRRGRASAA